VVLSIIILFLSSFSAILLAVPGDDPGQSDPIHAGTMATTLIDFTVSPSRAHVGEEITFFANASSTTASSLTFTIFFDSRLVNLDNNTESPVETLTIDENPAFFSITYAYDHIGNLTHPSLGTYFLVRLYAGDGSNTLVGQLPVYIVADNFAPTYSIKLKPSASFNEADDEFDGRTLTLDSSYLAVKVSDVDDDPLTVTWDFGDGDEAENTTGASAAGVWANQTHSWTVEVPPGEGDFYVDYTVTVTTDDGNGHEISCSMLINLTIPTNIGPLLFVSAPAYANPGVEMTVRANATDQEGDPLTWTFDYGDGSFAVFDTGPTPTSALVWMNATHVYDGLGDYSITVYVSDALVPNQVGWHNVSTTVSVTVRNNSAPVVAPISLSTTTLVIDDETGVLSLVLSVQVTDADHDALVVEWDFGDSTEHELNTTLGGIRTQTFRMTHNYTDPGSFNVTVVVSDTSEHSVTVYRVLSVTSTNRPPVARELMFDFPLGNKATLNGSMGFILVVYDLEGDPLFVAWEFGDGSPSVYMVITEFDSNSTATVSVNHTNTDVGTFPLTVTVTDNTTGVGNHTVVTDRTVDVIIPSVAVVWIWDWWDYTSLAMFCMIPIAPALWMIYMRRKSRLLETQGLTLEEFKMRKDELGDVLRRKKD
jgi:hypothetical protein